MLFRFFWWNDTFFCGRVFCLQLPSITPDRAYRQAFSCERRGTTKWWMSSKPRLPQCEDNGKKTIPLYKGIPQKSRPTGHFNRRKRISSTECISKIPLRFISRRPQRPRSSPIQPHPQRSLFRSDYVPLSTSGNDLATALRNASSGSKSP